MTSYNGQNITYDSIGNPLNYLNGWNFEWKNGRQLDKMVNSGYNVNVSCKYDEGGVRTKKAVKSIKDGNEITKTTDFITDGIQILSQKTTTVVTDTATGNQLGDPVTDTIIWQIDGEGTALGFIYNGEVYYYLKNAQGDIVGIADKDSNIVASYTYDSWGKLVSIIDPSQDNLDVTGDTNHIGYINPLRYRGYYYDSETSLYYLNARYYDPETGRFINSDDNLSGLNLYRYCANNPIIFSDFDGQNPVALSALLLTPELAVPALAVSAVMLPMLLTHPKLKSKVDEAIAWAIKSCVYSANLIAEKFKELGENLAGKIANLVKAYNIYTIKQKVPSKLKDGDKVKTPDSHPDEFQKENNSPSFKHKKTGWKMAKDLKGEEADGGPHWDLAPPSRGKGHINVGPERNIFGGRLF